VGPLGNFDDARVSPGMLFATKDAAVAVDTETVPIFLSTDTAAQLVTGVMFSGNP
jgi:hypothetical protein